MSDINIEVAGGTSIRLLTAGKYCDKNILVTALSGGESGGRLPSGYTELTYIQSTGTQYIDTGFKPNQNTRVVMDTFFIEVPTTTHAALLGVRNASADQYWSYYRYNEKGLSIRFGTSGDSVIPCVPTTRTKVDMNKNTLTAYGETVSVTANNFSSSYNMFLIAVNNAGLVQYCSIIRLFSCQVYDNGTLVRDFVPCQTADDEVGLYDLVNNVFYANKGTGKFVGGELVNSSEYPIWTGGYY